MAARRTSVVSFLNLTEAEGEHVIFIFSAYVSEVRLLEEIDDLPDGENIYLEICEEESKNFTSLTTFHGMVIWLWKQSRRVSRFEYFYREHGSH